MKIKLYIKNFITRFRFTFENRIIYFWVAPFIVGHSIHVLILSNVSHLNKKQKMNHSKKIKWQKVKNDNVRSMILIQTSLYLSCLLWPDEKSPRTVLPIAALFLASFSRSLYPPDPVFTGWSWRVFLSPYNQYINVTTTNTEIITIKDVYLYINKFKDLF